MSTRCDICKGTGFVEHVRDGGGDYSIRPSLSDEITFHEACNVKNGPCPRCEGSGQGDDYRDFDRQMLRIVLPPDDDGTPGNSVDIYCERSHAIGSSRPVSANVDFATGDTRFSLIGLSVSNLNVIARHFRDYAERMGKW